MIEPKPEPGTPQAPYASAFERYAAEVKDRLVAAVLVYAPLAVAFAFGREGLGFALAGGGLLFAFAHELVGTALWGQTLGKKVQRIRVVRIADGEVPGFACAIRRLGWEQIVIPIGVLFRSDHRGFHDRRAGTAVIRVARRQRST